ncbi:MAG: ATP-binding protein [Clostridia bacterium]|nr:ATP-binding protein [Clostridia bacterium]
MTRAEAISYLENEYAKKRESAEREWIERRERIFAGDPKIRELQDTLSNALSKAARLLVADPGNAAANAERLREETLAARGAIRSRLTKAGFDADALEIRYSCPLCKDTGYTGLVPRIMCACMEKQLNALVYAQDAFGSEERETFQSFREDIYPNEAQKKQALAIRDLCLQYADAYPNTGKNNLLILGTAGLGKTFLLNAIAERVARNGHVYLKMTAYRMHQSMRAHFLNLDDGKDGFEQMVKAPLLLIDDLGTEPMMKNITLEYLFILLNERGISGRHTVIASNLMPNDMLARYGERIVSRLLNQATTRAVCLTGEDLRLKGRL